MQAARNGEISYWHAEMGGLPPVRPALPGDRNHDVCIVGAGFTGLWTAWYLKQAAPDLSIIVIEREFAGFGASGRNGGWLSGTMGWNRERYLSSGSRQGVIAFEAALRDAVDEVIRVATDQGIDAHILRTDEIVFACSPAQLARLEHEYANAIAWGCPPDRIGMLGAAEATRRIRIRDAAGALLIRGVARIQPARLVRGLADAVERAGVKIYEQTAATGISPGAVTTEHGTVRAPVVIRATEGYTPGFAGRERDLLALNSALVVTEPVPEALWREIGWQERELLGDARHSYCYAQRTADNRIALGGRGVPYRFANGTDDRGRTQQQTIDRLHAILLRLLPQAAELRLDHAWCGVLGVPRDWCASVGFDRSSGFGWAGGYVGVGIATSNLAGRTLADLVVGRDTQLTGLPWVNRTVRRWEPEPLRWLGVRSMYWLYDCADRREQRSGGEHTSRLAVLANRIAGR